MQACFPARPTSDIMDPRFKNGLVMHCWADRYIVSTPSGPLYHPPNMSPVATQINTGSQNPTGPVVSAIPTNRGTRAFFRTTGINRLDIPYPVPVDHPIRITGDQASMAAWVRPTTVGVDYMIVIGKYVAPGAHTSPYFSYALQILNTGEIRSYWTSGASFYQAQGGLAIADEWQHIAGTYDGATIRTYLNGYEVANDSMTGNLNDYAYGCGIGANGGFTESFDGMIDDVMIWNRWVTPGEIIELSRPGRNPVWSRRDTLTTTGVNSSKWFFAAN